MCPWKVKKFQRGGFNMTVPSAILQAVAFASVLMETRRQNLDWYGRVHATGDVQHVLKDILQKPPHYLSAQEINLLWHTFPLGKTSESNFSFKSARTIDLNGRRVIESEGSWGPGSERFSAIPDATEYCITYDLWDNGEAAAEIYLRASEKDFPNTCKRLRNQSSRFAGATSNPESNRWE